MAARLFWTASTALALTLAAPSLVWAQDSAAPAAAAAADDAAGDEEILVTARRVAERGQDIPVVVTAFGAETLQEQNIVEIQDLRNSAPSFNVAPSPTGSAFPSITIRGQGQSRSLIGQDQSAIVYYAEFANPFALGTNQALYDVSSVQVLNGPQGTLFGRNTTGGAILITPNRPSEDFEAMYQVQAGNYNMLRGQGMVNIPLGEFAALRLAGSVNRRDGYIVNTLSGQDTGNQDDTSFRATFRLTPTENFETTFYYDHIDDDGTPLGARAVACRTGSPADNTFPGPNGFLASCAREADGDPLDIESNETLFGHATGDMLINVSTLDLNDTFSLKNIAGYREVSYTQVLDVDGTGVPVIKIYPSDDFARWGSEEFQLIATYDNFNWIAGIYYYFEEGHNVSTISSLQTSPASAVQTLGGEAENTSLSVYAQGTYRFTDALDGLALTVGGRFTRDEREITALSRIISPTTSCLVRDETNTPLPANDCARSASTTFEEPTYTVSLDYKITDDILAYVTHRRGYRSGGFNIRATADSHFDPFSPEIVLDYEVGLKADWSLGGMPVRTNFAVYTQEYEDIQRQVPFIVSTTPLTISTNVINAASATIDGAEVQVRIQPFEGFELEGFYSFTDPQYESFDSAGTDLSSNRFANIPEHVSSVTARYSFEPFGSNMGEVTAQLTYYNQTSFAYSDVNEGGFADGYELFNGRVGWRNFLGTDVDVAVFGQNLADERYELSGDSKYGQLGYISAFSGPPRMYGIEIRQEF